MATVILFRTDRCRPAGPTPLVWAIIDALVEVTEAERELRRAHGSPPPPPRLRLVPPDELEPEWDSEDSNAYQDRVEAGLEPEWPDD